MTCLRLFLHAFIAAAFLCGNVPLSFAQTPPNRAAASFAPEPGVLIPTSGWLVGPASSTLPSGISGMPLPCVMTNQFDNGFVLRLSGGGQHLAALAIDFRQPIFTPGQRYPLQIFILPDYQNDFTATAHDEGTLIVDLREDSSVYRALESAKAMDLSIGPTVARFDLTGLTDGLARMESCFAPPKSSLPVRDVRALRATPAEPEIQTIPDFSESASEFSPDIQPLPVRNADPLNIFEKEPPPLRSDEKAVFSEDKLNGFESDPASLPMDTSPSPDFAQDVPVAKSDERSVWRATKGEDVREVLARWSEKAGVSLVWTAKRGGRVGRDFRYEGPFDEAVQSFLAQAGKFQGSLQPDRATSGLPELQNKPGDMLKINR